MCPGLFAAPVCRWHRIVGLAGGSHQPGQT